MNGLQFDIEIRADGLRIYARLGQQTVGALDVENCGPRKDGELSAAVVYVVPRWRSNGIEDALRECLALHAAKTLLIRG
ncbi:MULTISPECIES: hypothetical protein [unclassified Herbaspirillum]|uniref:hypothetical protein n=1 Tax=unclassified Herbaspirillum TaxID=2624150 RepID=UPI000E2E896C|nr:MULTISPECIES: hypothetical protein [unclassified Herbaspirillum]RFB68792.1 hypothetical protein DZB54_16855 [Herbaspirillum sp. 3R-3a1]TFI13392.1 hypothetical protein E4P31_17065 [Herbaspirillum sp. 3R-11]